MTIGLLVATGCKKGDEAQQQKEQAETSADAPEQVEAKKEDEAGEPEDEASSGESETFPEHLSAGESGNYGGDFTIADDPVTLASALETAESGETYKVTARVEKVCKKKGCWFTLADEGVEEPVRVKMKDYGFFVPRNADGATATVEGELIRRTVPKKEAEHYAKDEVAGTDKKPAKVEGDQEKWEMKITAAKMEMPGESEKVKN